MRPSIALLVICLSSVFVLANEQTDMLKADFKLVKAVARIRVESVQKTDGVGDLSEYRILARIIESFKGSFRTGGEVEFYEVTENSFSPISGEKIVFLNRLRSYRDGSWIFAALENSTRPTENHLLQELRKLQKPGGRKRKRAAVSLQPATGFTYACLWVSRAFDNSTEP
jgi:hypothetical protein